LNRISAMRDRKVKRATAHDAVSRKVCTCPGKQRLVQLAVFDAFASVARFVFRRAR